MTKTSFKLDQHRAFLERCLENDPHPIAPKDYEHLHNNTGSELVSRSFVQLLRHQDGRTKLYLINDVGREYLSEMIRYDWSDKPAEGSYLEVLRTFQLEGRDELYFSLVMHLLEIRQIQRQEVIARFKNHRYPQARAIADLLTMLPAVGFEPSERKSVSEREVRRGVALTPFDSENLRIVGEYLDSVGIDGNYTHAFTYALQIAAQLAKTLSAERII